MNTALTVVLCIAAAIGGIWLLWNFVVLCILIAVGRSVGKTFDNLTLDGPVFPKIETRTVRGRIA